MTAFWTLLVTTIGPLIGTLVGTLGSSLLVQRKLDRTWVTEQYGLCANQRQEKFEQWTAFRQKVLVTYSPEVDSLIGTSGFQPEIQEVLLAYSRGFKLLKSLNVEELKKVKLMRL